MKSTRRTFIKRGFLATLGSFLFPHLFVNSEIGASEFIPLNYSPSPSEWSSDTITVSWIGHSTILINFFGKWILTDPVLMKRIGLYFLGTSIGPTRLTPPALMPEEIPKPDIILLSHAHMDHMDYPTLKELTKMYPSQIDVVTAYNTSDVIADLNWKSLTVLDWNEETNILGLNIKAFEVKHFGWRFPWEKDRSRGFFEDGRSYNAYLISGNGKTVLFGGDMAESDKLKVIQNKKIDIALMPIGAYDPWIQSHCTPEQALQMAEEINAEHFIPMHTKTFQQGKEPFNEPVERMLAAAPIYKPKVVIDEIGQTYSLGT